MKKDMWEENLRCAIKCSHCESSLLPEQKRILSVYDHTPICLTCQEKEKSNPDYEEVSKNMIGSCMAETEVLYSDPGGYCLYHFHPFTCK